MKNGILRPDEGFTIAIDGTTRSFRDLEHHALDAARLLWQKNRGTAITVISHSDGVCARGVRRRADVPRRQSIFD